MEKSRLLKTASIILSIWAGIFAFLSSLILIIVILFRGNSPLIVMVFEQSEIAGLDQTVISSLNCLTILYNSCAVALSILVLYIIWSGLINGKRRAFWALLITIGFVQILAFIASVAVGNARWQVNVLLSVLYVVGIGLAGYSIFIRNQTNKSKNPG
jgi:hypothetical protein